MWMAHLFKLTVCDLIATTYVVRVLVYDAYDLL